MLIDFYGLHFQTTRATFYLWSPWRACALEHRLFGGCERRRIVKVGGVVVLNSEHVHGSRLPGGTRRRLVPAAHLRRPPQRLPRFRCHAGRRGPSPRSDDDQRPARQRPWVGPAALVHPPRLIGQVVFLRPGGTRVPIA